MVDYLHANKEHSQCYNPTPNSFRPHSGCPSWHCFLVGAECGRHFHLTCATAWVSLTGRKFRRLPTSRALDLRPLLFRDVVKMTTTKKDGSDSFLMLMHDWYQRPAIKGLSVGQRGLWVMYLTLTRWRDPFRGCLSDEAGKAMTLREKAAEFGVSTGAIQRAEKAFAAAGLIAHEKTVEGRRVAITDYDGWRRPLKQDSESVESETDSTGVAVTNNVSPKQTHRESETDSTVSPKQTQPTPGATAPLGLNAPIDVRLDKGQIQVCVPSDLPEDTLAHETDDTHTDTSSSTSTADDHDPLSDAIRRVLHNTSEKYFTGWLADTRTRISLNGLTEEGAIAILGALPPASISGYGNAFWTNHLPVDNRPAPVMMTDSLEEAGRVWAAIGPRQ